MSTKMKKASLTNMASLGVHFQPESLS